MFEISWSELFILVVVALIFVQPKDLPYFFNTLGRYFGELKRQAGEFRRHFEDAMREAEMENLRKELGEVEDHVRHGLTDIGNLSERRQKEISLPDKGSSANSIQKDPATPLPDGSSEGQEQDRLPLRQVGDP